MGQYDVTFRVILSTSMSYTIQSKGPRSSIYSELFGSGEDLTVTCSRSISTSQLIDHDRADHDFWTGMKQMAPVIADEAPDTTSQYTI